MNSINHPLVVTSSKVLEQWAMMIVDKVEPSTELFDASSKLLRARVNFEGILSGTVSVFAQKDFMGCLAQNLLVLDEDSIDDEDRRDAFREITNVITGNFLTEAYGYDEIFRLNPPNVEECEVEELQDLLENMSKFVFAFRADDQPVLMTFYIERW